MICISDLYNVNQNVAQMTEPQEVIKANRRRNDSQRKGQSKEERERDCEGVLGEDKHLWGSQLLNNSDRDSQHSVQRRSTVRSAHSLQRRGREGLYGERERGRVYKDSMREEDITVKEFSCVCMCTFVSVSAFVYVCVCIVCIYA